MIRKNPFDFELVNVIVNDTVRRDALSPENERKFLKFIKEDFCYSFLKKGFSKLLECAKNQDYKQLETLADALHNTPIFFAEGCKNFKKSVKIQFAQYNSIYKTNLLKELSN